MKLSILFIISIFLVAACSVQHTGKLHLVSGGESAYTIVLPVNPSQEEIRAAHFLNYHIHEIAGCQLPIVHAGQLVSGNTISISKSADFDNDDDYSVKTSGGSLFISGGKGKGCIYGVAEILEKYLGVRYYSPDFAVIPKSDKVTLPALNFKGTSTNTYRNVNGNFTTHENYKDFNRLHTISDMFATGYYVHTFHRLVPWSEYFHTNPEYFGWHFTPTSSR